MSTPAGSAKSRSRNGSSSRRKEAESQPGQRVPTNGPCQTTFSAIDGEKFANAVRRHRIAADTFKLAAMNAAANDGKLDEASLIKLYRELTGASEACARSVYMFVNREEDEEKHQTNGLDNWRTEEERPFVTKRSPVCTESDEEFGIGLLGSEGLAFAGK